MGRKLKAQLTVLPYSGNAAVIYLYFKLLEYAAGCAEAIINRGSFRSSSESRLQNIFVTGWSFPFFHIQGWGYKQLT